MDAIKLFKQFKLGNSVFTGCFKVDRYETERAKIPAEEIERRTIRQMVDNLSNLIISKNQSAITKEENALHIDYRLQLLVLKVDDFKTIVEAAIQMMPDEAIQKIKNGQSVEATNNNTAAV